MMAGLVRWTVAAFMSNPEADVEELIAILESVGVPNAERAVMFVPLAYGRQILEGIVRVPDTYVDDGVEHPLADEPIFVAARELARDAGRAELERIGLTSSEVHAVNAALQQGSKPADLVMSPPHMRLGPRGQGTLPEAQPLVDALVKRHGGQLPLQTRAFPGSVKRGQAQVQLDVVAKLGNREIVESFAGVGPNVATAVDQAVDKFARASLHVLLAVLAGEDGADQVTWETCGSFRVCSGPLMRMWAQQAVDYAPVFDALLARLAAANLSRELHWARLFIAIGPDNKQLGLDALLDNQPWQPAVELAQSWPWPAGERAYALRHFFMLVPA